MTTGWTRVCPDCGNNDGAKVERIAFHPTFRCACGYVWEGAHATFVAVWKVEAHGTGKEVGRFANVIAEQMIALAQHPND